MTAEVALHNITMRFNGFTALNDITLLIPKGGYLVLLGPSGCGKSTLLSILGGFLQPTGGHVLIGGQDVTSLPAARRPTTTMFQDYALFPHLTLLDNVAFGLRMQGMAKHARHGKAADLLALVGLPDVGQKRPHELSGGQRQRVALARALAVEPDVLLLDEPLGALDLKLRRAMQDELKAIQARVGTTFVHVTHDQEEAMAIADTIVVMNAGRIEDQGSPARLYLRPASLFAAKFMGEINLIAGQGNGRGVDTPFGQLPVSASGPVTLGLRPEAFRDTGGQAMPLGHARIDAITFFGTHCRAHLTANGVPMIAHLPQTTGLGVGDTIPLAVAAEHVILLPPVTP